MAASRFTRSMIEPLEIRRLLNAGNLDTTFGNAGVTNANFAGATFQVKATAVESWDGKIVLAGIKGNNAAVARLNADGSYDTTFGNGGLAELLTGTQNEPLSAEGVAIQGDGKVVIVGGTGGSSGGFSVARFTASGALDTSFGPNGTGVAAAYFGDEAYATCVTLQSDGKILVAGSALTGSIFSGSQNQDFAVVRFNTNGSIDTSFADGGVRDAGFGYDEFANAIAVDYNGTPSSNPYWGSIAVTGYLKGDDAIPSSSADFAVLKLTSNGNPDTSFDGDGKVTTRFPQGDSFASGVVIEPGGKIVATGTLGPDYLPDQFGSHDFALARYLPSGALDTSFGSDGTGREISGYSDRNEVANAGIASYIGGVLMAGESDGHLEISAFTSSGVPDTRFAGTGSIVVDLPGAGAYPTPGVVAMASYPQRRFVVAAAPNVVARYVDVGSVVAAGSFNPYASEQGPQSASFIVGRTQNLSTAERIYFNISGTATKPGNIFHQTPDYTGTNIHFGSDLIADPTYVDIPANQSYTVVTITPNDDSLVEGDETAVFSIASNYDYDIGTPPSSTIVIRDNDITAGPVVRSSQFLFDSGSPQRAQFTFNQNVSSSISGSDFVVTGPNMTNVPFRFGYDDTTDTATLNFIGTLPDGNYTARAVASGITNSSGTPMASDSSLDFFTLAGDANHDRKVDIVDLGILASNWQASEKTFSQGDSNYDGVVNIVDLGILASNWQKTLAAPASLRSASMQSSPFSNPISGLAAVPVTPARKTELLEELL